MLLYLAEALWIAVDGDALLFLVLIELVLNTIVDKVKNKLIHVESFLLLESEHALVVEKETQRTCSTEVSVKLIEY